MLSLAMRLGERGSEDNAHTHERHRTWVILRVATRKREGGENRGVRKNSAKDMFEMPFLLQGNNKQELHV